ncbi:MAG: hypothetical protein K5978_00870, partial [Campylobacter sp.]|nr:hypothetical protein [Campylobacter sp.]
GTDALGNTSVGMDLTYTLDTTAPEIYDVTATAVDTDTVADMTAEKAIFNVKTEPNAKVFILNEQGRLVAAGRADANGDFEITGKAVQLGEKITVKTEDNFGNMSKLDDIIVDKIIHPNDKSTEVAITSIIDDKANYVIENGNVVEKADNTNVLGKTTNDNTPTLNGTGEAGATITVFDGTKELGTTEVGADGKWTFEVKKPLSDGEHEISVSARDRLGNTNTINGNPAVASAMVLVDTSAADIISKEFTNNIDNDNVTDNNVNGRQPDYYFTGKSQDEEAYTLNRNEVRIENGKVTADVQFKFYGDVKAGDSLVYTYDIEDNRSGNKWNERHGVSEVYTLTASDVANGYANVPLVITGNQDFNHHTLRVKGYVVDQAGNKGEDLDPKDINLDIVGPRAITAIKNASFGDDVTAEDGFTTTDTTPTISGVLDYYSYNNYEVYNAAKGTGWSSNNDKYGAVAMEFSYRAQGESEWTTLNVLVDRATGKFEFTMPNELSEGNYETKIVPIDQAGNKGAEYTWQNFSIESAIPDTPVITDVYNDYGYRIDNNGLTNDPTPSIVGTAKAGLTVKLYDGSEFIGETVADAYGNFEFTPSKLKDGDHDFTAVAVSASNKDSAPSNVYGVSTDTDEFATANVNVEYDYSIHNGGKSISQANGTVWRINSGSKGTATLEDIEYSKYVNDVHQGYCFKSTGLDYATGNDVNRYDRLSYNAQYDVKDGYVTYRENGHWIQHDKGWQYTNALKTFLGDDADTLLMDRWVNSNGQGTSGQLEGTIRDDLVYSYITVDGYMYIEAGTYTLTAGDGIDSHLNQYVNDMFRMCVKDLNGNQITDGKVKVDFVQQNGDNSRDLTLEVSESGFYKVDVAYADSFYGVGYNTKWGGLKGSESWKNKLLGDDYGDVYQQTASLKPAFRNENGEIFTVGDSKAMRFIDPCLLPDGLTLNDIQVVQNDEAFVVASGLAVYNLSNGILKIADSYKAVINVEVSDPDGTPLAEGTRVDLTYKGETHDLYADSEGKVSYAFDLVNGKGDSLQSIFEFDVSTSDKAGNEICQHFLVDNSDKDVSFNWSREGRDLNFKTGAGDDYIATGRGDDIVDAGEGSDTIITGAGDDRIVFDANDRYIDGGAGNDTLVIKENIDFGYVNDLAYKVNNIEALDMRGDASEITINADDVLGMTDDISTILKIDGDAGDRVRGDWVESANQNADNGYVLYEGQTSAGQTVYIQIDDKVSHEF